MKKITFTILAAITIATSAMAQNTDSLQMRLDTAKDLCTKAELYTNIAANLVQFNQPQTKPVSTADAAKATDYVLKAIHINSHFSDTTALRNNFDLLGQAYFVQKKYTQAKWFFLQSACISRDARDVPHIIYSLLQLSMVKTAIKDYALAQKDLQEAIVLSKYEYNVPQQIEVEKKLAVLYDQTGKLKEAKGMVAHYTLLANNYKKERAMPVIAMQKPAKVRKSVVTEPKPIITFTDYLSAGTNTAETTANLLPENR